jgi:stage II sporulation protein AA (anti-sigma F factor antagonist)
MIDFNEINLRIEVFPAKDNYQVVEFKGNLDKIGLEKAEPMLEEVVNNLKVNFLVFNFEKLDFINSEGIGLMLTLHARLIKREMKLVIAGANSHVKDVFDVIGMTKIISCFDSLNECIDSLKS